MVNAIRSTKLIEPIAIARNPLPRAAADTNITATPLARARVGREDGQRPQKDLLGTAKPGERLQARSGRGMEIIPYQNFFYPAYSDFPLGDRTRDHRELRIIGNGGRLPPQQ
jgi:hypothetical protein